MHKFSTAVFVALSFLLPTLSYSQTSSPVWFTLNAPEGSVVKASNAITLRFGQLASTCAAVNVSRGPCSGATIGTPTPAAWTAAKTFALPSGSSTVSVTVNAASFNGVDPIPGVYKTVQIQEQANPQTVTANGKSVTVPANSATCQLVANPSSISFQNTTVGFTLSSTANIASNCPTTITVSSVKVSGPYSVSGFQTPFTIASGQKQNYTAVFAPTAAGTANGTITFVSNATTNPNLSVSLGGTGVTATTPQPTLTSNVSSLGFGNVTVNSPKSQTVTITNGGSTSVSVSSVKVTGTGFSISAVTTPFTLASQQSKQITVTLTPTTSGSASGSLTITSNATNPMLTVALAGAGVAATTSHKVTLSWNPGASQAAGYNVYRSTVSGGPYSKINTSLLTNTSYTDNAVTAGKTYYYTVTAVASNGAESGFSNQATVAVPTP